MLRICFVTVLLLFSTTAFAGVSAISVIAPVNNMHTDAYYVQFSWTSATDSGGNQISYQFVINSSSGKTIFKRDTTGTTARISNFKPGNTYYWAVFPKNNIGEWGKYTGWTKLVITNDYSKPAVTITYPNHGSFQAGETIDVYWGSLHANDSDTMYFSLSRDSDKGHKSSGAYYLFNETEQSYKAHKQLTIPAGLQSGTDWRLSIRNDNCEKLDKTNPGCSDSSETLDIGLTKYMKARNLGYPTACEDLKDTSYCPKPGDISYPKEWCTGGVKIILSNVYSDDWDTSKFGDLPEAGKWANKPGEGSAFYGHLIDSNPDTCSKERPCILVLEPSLCHVMVIYGKNPYVPGEYLLQDSNGYCGGYWDTNGDKANRVMCSIDIKTKWSDYQIIHPK